MKWYSIKKYKPITCNELLVRIEKDTGSYDRYLIASCDDYDTKYDPTTWNLSNGQIIGVDLAEYIVTHFAIIDPVLIEEEE